MGWRKDLYKQTGRNSTRQERKAFKEAYVDPEAVDTRYGQGTYSQLYNKAVQQQFGANGVPELEDQTRRDQREINRFNRRFDRQLRNGKLAPRVIRTSPTVATTPVQSTTTTRTVNPIFYNLKPFSSLWQNPYNIGIANENPIVGEENSQGGRSTAGNGQITTPVAGQKTNVEWNAIAAEKLGEGKTMQDVIALQKQMGITADGKWGKQTQAAYDAYQQRIQNERLMGPTPDFVSPGTYFDVNGPSPLMKHSAYGNLGYTPTSSATPVTQTQNQFNFDNFVNEQNLPGDNIISKDGHRYVRFDPKGSGDFYVGDDGNIYSAGMFGTLGNITDGNEMMNIDGTDTYVHGKKYRDNYNYLYNLINPVSKQKQGGKMNRIKYFQQGGQMQQQDPKQQITQLVQAAMQGDEQATQQINQVFEAAKQGDQQAQQIAQMIQQVVQELKGQATVAKWGSKLNYIRSLKYVNRGCTTCQ